ncbi:MAG: hypothetical protein MJY78_07965, partial [Fibrobacter sp.]|nr:hypothetical protein [Fibrobacter sp.]
MSYNQKVPVFQVPFCHISQKIVFNNLPQNPFSEFLTTKQKMLIHKTGRLIAEEIRKEDH